MTACAILYTYLVDCLSVIIEAKPKVLKGLAKADSLSVLNIIDLGNYDKIFNKIKGEILSRFDFMGIQDKLDYLSDKLKINVAGASRLQAHNASVQNDFSKGIDLLFSTYQLRNDIVHKDRQPITRYADLIYQTQYMILFMLDLAFVMSNQFAVANDFMEKATAINNDPDTVWKK